MKTKILSILIIVVISFHSCKKNDPKSDRDYPDLPAYSEKGLNVGGMLINDTPWLTIKPGLFSTTKPLQLLSFPEGDSIVILINGYYKDVVQTNLEPKTIFVVIKNIKIANDEDIIQLNGKEYILDGSVNYGGFSESFGINKQGQGVGFLKFGKVSRINNFSIGNGTPNNPIRYAYIVAGRLEMNVSTSSNYSIEQGRFDISVTGQSSEFIIY